MAHLNAIPVGVRELQRLLEPAWPDFNRRLRESGVPLNLEGDDPRSLDEIEDRQQAIRGRIQELDNEFRGQTLPDDARGEWNSLNEEFDRNKRVVDELRARQERVRALAEQPSQREEGATFHTPSTRKGDDVWDYSHAVRGATSADGMRGMLRDQALRAVERTRFPHPSAERERCQEALERCLARDDEFGSVARRILNTGNPVYERAFTKTLAGAPVTTEEQRALGLTNTAGGYAVPFALDPTLIPTSNGAVNPYRQVARVEQIAVTTWQGVTSAGVTASRVSEATEASDNAPTIAQPAVTPQRVQVFIPFSIEIGMDWSGMQGDLATLIQDAKDAEEATSFTTGSGTAPAAQGVVTGATTVFTAAGTASLAVADLYNAEAALPPRHRPVAQWVANRAIYSRVRQFDTAGGASLWVPSLRDALQNRPTGNLGYELLGYPANEASPMATALTTGNIIAVLGNFSRFIIVDRMGMDIEIIPHLFGTNRRPTGQRGIYAVWRNNSAVLDANAFVALKTG